MFRRVSKAGAKLYPIPMSELKENICQSISGGICEIGGEIRVDFEAHSLAVLDASSGLADVGECDMDNFVVRACRR